MRKPLLLMLLAGAALPAPAVANDLAAASTTTRVREVARPAPPIRPRATMPVAILPHPPPPAPRPLPTDIAPMPNRDIEAPPDRFARPLAPVLEPAIIDQRERRRGFTFGSEHLREVQDNGLNNLVPGARLRIPIE